PELGRRQCHLGGFAAHRVRDRIEANAGGLHPAVAAGPAEQRLETPYELRERERLRQVVVTTGVEAGDAIDDPVSCGEEEHRRLQAARPQRLAEVAAVGIWQPDVDYERVDARPVDVFERRGAGGNRVHGEAFLA